MRLTFHGASGGVTGSNYLLESGGHKVLVDCGLFQGSHYADRQNFEPFAYNPEEVHAVFVTHPHLDHVGRLPKLVKDGFCGDVYSTAPARDLAELILIDSEHILAKEAEREKRPSLCTLEDVARLMELWKPVEYHGSATSGPFTVTWYDAGHILGSAFLLVEAEGTRIVFSGDLGNSPAPIIKPTEPLVPADYCVMESTYGDRLHQNIDERREMLENAIEDTAKSGGVLLIPAFALERTQELLYHLHQLFEEGRIPPMPVFIDSPLAIKMTAVYKKYENYFNKASSKLVRSGDDILNFPGLRLTLTTEESKRINEVPPPKVIMAGSGMSHGGRILHHERRYLSDPKSMILFVGYQARGSLGRQILDGAREVTIFREEISVRCKKRVVSGYSAHADQSLLMTWLRPQRMALKKVFMTHGEPEVSAVFAQKVRDEFAVSTEAPSLGETIEL